MRQFLFVYLKYCRVREGRVIAGVYYELLPGHVHPVARGVAIYFPYTIAVQARAVTTAHPSSRPCAA